MSKPSITVIKMARKPLSEGSVAGNVLKWECGGLNIDGARIGTESTQRTQKPQKNTNMNPGIWKGGVTGSDCGRWPSNIVLGHLTGCRVDGVRKVQALQLTAGKRTSPNPGSGECSYQKGTGRSYTTEGGKEDIPNWACAGGCPVSDLGDSTGASRYFKQVAADE
jgi:hypothetical protein